MIVKNKYGEIDIDLRGHKKILVSHSGGADSTLMFWLFLKFTPVEDNVLFIPVTGVTPAKGKFKYFTSLQNLQNLREDFPDHNIAERMVMYNDTQEEFGDWTVQLLKEGVGDLRTYGLTKNPPMDVMEEHNLVFKRPEDRDAGGTIWTNDPKKGISYQPFRCVDKRFVAECYREFKLMDRYYNNTFSCERFRETEDMRHSEEPCGHCWWCREKKMAFGILDGQHEIIHNHHQ